MFLEELTKFSICISENKTNIINKLESHGVVVADIPVAFRGDSSKYIWLDFSVVFGGSTILACPTTKEDRTERELKYKDFMRIKFKRRPDYDANQNGIITKINNQKSKKKVFIINDFCEIQEVKIEQLNFNYNQFNFVTGIDNVIRHGFLANNKNVLRETLRMLRILMEHSKKNIV